MSYRGRCTDVDSVGLILCVDKFIKLFPDTQYFYLASIDEKYRTISIDAVEPKEKFQQAGEILEE